MLLPLFYRPVLLLLSFVVLGMILCYFFSLRSQIKYCKKELELETMSSRGISVVSSIEEGISDSASNSGKFNSSIGSEDVGNRVILGLDFRSHLLLMTLTLIASAVAISIYVKVFVHQTVSTKLASFTSKFLLYFCASIFGISCFSVCVLAKSVDGGSLFASMFGSRKQKKCISSHKLSLTF